MNSSRPRCIFVVVAYKDDYSCGVLAYLFRTVAVAAAKHAVPVIRICPYRHEIMAFLAKLRVVPNTCRSIHVYNDVIMVGFLLI